MKILQQNYLRKAIAVFALANVFAVLISELIAEQTVAQITPDATLTNPTVVFDTNPLFTITGGTTAGANLFHSFSQFSVPTLTEAFFDNPLAIQNILVRVTGGNISSIDGLISANGDANLFLINPNGIVFDQNASLDIGGSFLATTANSVRFIDGSEFRANANTQTTSPLLLVSAPIGLQFNGLTNGAIAAQSSFLNVQAGQTLALVGGDVTLQGANLYVESGRIELGSVAGNGFVAIAPTANGLVLNYDQAPNLGNIRLEQIAIADVSGINGGGNIQVQGRQVILDSGSQLQSISLGDGNGSEVFVRATELFAAIGSLSGIFTNTRPNASGNGSNITIDAKRVELTNGGRIEAVIFGSGKGGDIRINASDILLTSVFDARISTIRSQVLDANATGNGGNIIITTNNLLMNEYATVISDTNGIGDAGKIDITAKNIDLISNNNQDDSYATIDSGVAPDATGNGGILKITTDNLQLTGGSYLTASTFGIGNAGKIDITAKNIILDGSNSVFPSEISTGSYFDGTGNGGDVKITADSIVLKNGGLIAADTQSDGNGNAGNLLINAKLIDISGQNDTNRSGLFSNATFGNGNGGNIEINSDRLIVRDNGIISASNFNDRLTEADPNTFGSGLVGNITINSSSILLDQGSINIDSLSGSRGNINLNSNLILLRNGSTISTNALGNAIGGNNFINTDFLVAVPTENSDITANSVNSFGGRNIITAKGLIGFQTGNRLTQLSDITAASSLGTQFNGLVEIRAPDTDLSRGLVKLPDNLTDGNKQIVAACDRIRGNEFIVTGRGGVPSNATKVISSQAIWRDLRLSEIPSTQSSPTAQMTSNQVASQPFPKIEAQGWEKSANGNLKLLAYADSPPVWRSPVVCPVNSIK
jgi:filamentous hemagglutinin family protein